MDDLSKKHNRNLQSLGKASVPQGEDNVLSPQKFREAIINIDTTHNLTPAETTVEVENAENQPEVADHLENSNPMNRGQSRQKKNRIISINKEQKDRYVSNHVTTAKYSFLTFVPFFLYEQFRRYSNIFFLCTIILQQIPDVSPTGKYTTFIPFVTILSVSAIKELVEDIKRHRADKETNHRLVEVLRSRRFKTVLWKDVKVGEFVKIHCDQPIPGDTVLYSTSEPMGICYIETANLDGETNLKVRQAIPQTYKMIDTEDFLGIEGSIECELPNRLLYQFAGKIKLESEQTDLPLGPDQLLLRGAMLRNTKWVYGQIIYTGHETKLMLNSSKAPLKRSTLDKMTNNQIIFLFIVLIFVSLFSTAFYEFVVDHDTNNKYMGPTSGFGQSNKIGKFVFTFLTFSILYNNLIPISLSVTLEVVRFTQAKFINSDKDMYHAETDTPALARTSNLNEELGEIRYIFSDKTGTLTRNVMEFKGCSVAGFYYSPSTLFPKENEKATDSPLIQDLLSSENPNSETIREFLVLLSICHNVIPEKKTINGKANFIYHASSPDEKALVEGASTLGFKFQMRTPLSIEISAMGKVERYDILNLIEFTSTRKRMTVIVKCPDGLFRLYCKGADSVIFGLLTSKDKKNLMSDVERKTHSHLGAFSIQGLRTLCCAMKVVDKKDYYEWNTKYQKASNSINDREEAIGKAAELIEHDLILLGATAIEDKLQDLVPETIAAFLEAGIKIWVLTGDKQETAINIGNSCKLLDTSMTLLVINQEEEQHTLDCIVAYANRLGINLDHMNKRVLIDAPPRNAAVIVDGMTLVHAMKKDIREPFVSLCCQCKAVIVCRASPMQKAEIVELVTQATGAVSLAIGDGTKRFVAELRKKIQ
jgi:phospholipid-transporting ATPase